MSTGEFCMSTRTFTILHFTIFPVQATFFASRAVILACQRAHFACRRAHLLFYTLLFSLSRLLFGIASRHFGLSTDAFCMSTRTCTVLHFTIFPFQARGAFCMSTSTFSIYLPIYLSISISPFLIIICTVTSIFASHRLKAPLFATYILLSSHRLSHCFCAQLVLHLTCCLSNMFLWLGWQHIFDATCDRGKMIWN